MAMTLSDTDILSRDIDGVPRHINHIVSPYRPAGGVASVPRDLALAYLAGC